MNILSVNVNKFKSENGKEILNKVFEDTNPLSPDIAFFLEFDINNESVKNFLEKNNIYNIIYPSNKQEIQNHSIKSISICFTKDKKIKSLISPDDSYGIYRWNQIDLDNNISILSVHIPLDSRCESFWNAIIDYYCEMKKRNKKILIIGDFNTYDEGTVQRRKFYELLSKGGIDVFRAKGKALKTYKNKTRIDYAITSPSMYDIIKNVEVLNEFYYDKFTDHCGLFLEIKEEK